MTHPTDLDLAIELLRRHRYTVKPPLEDRAFIAVGGLRLDLESRFLAFGEHEVSVTPWQARILQVLMENCGQWCSRAHLQQELWVNCEPPASDALSVHIWNVRKKLQVVSGVENPVLQRRAAGYQLAPFFWRFSVPR